MTKLVAWFLVRFDYVAGRAFDWAMNKSEPLFNAMDEAEERLYNRKK